MDKITERPILMQGWGVRATLADRKTQTRRVIKHISPEWILNPGMEKIYTGILESPFPWNIHLNRKHMGRFGVFVQFQSAVDDTEIFFYPCPYGQPDDLLWVRETFCGAAPWGYDKRADGGEYWYRATDEGQCMGPWSPSIFMSKKATRLWLRVKDIRVGRVRDISVEDCFKEGVQIPVNNGKPLLRLTGNANNRAPTDYLQKDYTNDDFIRAHFAAPWDSINGHKPGCSWSDNPFSWIICYEKWTKQN